MLNEADKLQELANINKDASKFYDSAIEKVENPNIKETFGTMKIAHDNVVVNIQNYLRQAEAETEQAETTMYGEASKMWGNLMATMSSDVDETLVSHLEEAEDRCLHSIQDLISNDNILPGTRQILEDEYATLRKSHDHMKALKDNMKAAS